MHSIWLLFLLLALPGAGFSDRFKADPLFADQAGVRIEISLDKKVYRQSRFGEAPQIAIWFEDAEKSYFETVWVTRRTATGQWVGKIECPSCLPFWASRLRHYENSGLPSQKEPLPDGISGASPQEDLVITPRINEASDFEIFIEINISGDFNQAFPSVDEMGIPDHEGDGQPSLVYMGTYAFSGPEINQPELVGYVSRQKKETNLIKDTAPITSAKKIIKSIRFTILKTGKNKDL